MELTRWKRNPVKTFWSHVHEPKSIAVAMSVAYLMTFIVGAITLKGETQAVDYIHGLFLVTGGAFGVPTALFGYYKLEGRDHVQYCRRYNVANLTGLTSTGWLGLIVITFS